ncbi:ABC transporter substrate-binding protein [Demequina capsici]|uniref:ABC transporter substrate-binding protein n=1 Tax=Demequina capsici TaxID=3075620 RepID=A0AA96F773_9MICO|nr:ABC transporter substrate-binding protein [Demequina sp. OYTSA14]WNM25068.1 ABC transporter substrate-binding protein [Demequina sp. OYTSA14]
MHTTTRRFAAAALAAAAAVLMAACSSDTPQASTSESTTATADAAADAFPVTITGMYGDVTIESQPERVVTLGSREHELLYSLGIAPVAVPTSWKGYDYATGPWAEAAREAVNATPETFDTSTIDAEVIAGFNPDLIVATYTDLSQEEYTLLSQIAPVIVRGADDVAYGMSLTDELTVIGQATGTSDKAAEVIQQIDDEFAAVRDAHPEWAGKEGAVGFYYEGQAGVYCETDNRSQFLASVGLSTDLLASLCAGQTWVSLSAEQLDQLSGFDTILWQTAATPETEPAIEGLPLYASLGVTQKGGNLWITDETLEAALFANSPSSIAYSLSALVPQLEAALDGDPTTEIPVYADPSAA